MGGALTRWLLLLPALAGLGWLFGSVFEHASLPRADLVIGNGAEPQSLDPAAATAIPESRILGCLFEGLVVPDQRTLTPEPGMAQAWERSPDGLRWTFHLRPALRWSDGHPLTAPDLRWSYLRLLAPETGAEYAYQLWCVRGARAYTRGGAGGGTDLREAVGIHAPDDRTLVFELERPTPYFLDLMSFFALYPVPRHVIEKHGRDWVKAAHLVGNGPFRMRFRRLRDRIRVERNPHYWNASNIRLDTVDLLSISSKTTLLNLYVADEADWICDVPETAIPSIEKIYGRGGTGEYRPRAYLGTYYVRLNTTRPPFDNEKIRRALSLAVDRKSIVRNVTRAGEVPARSFIPPGLRGYEPPDILRFDPDEARRLFAEGLRELGLGRPPTVEYLYNTRTLHRAIAEVLQHQWWKVLGLKMRLRNMEWGSFQTATRSLDYMAARASWYGDYCDPNTFLDMYVSGGKNNQTGFSDPEYDRLVLQDAPRALDPERRTAILRRAEERLLLQAPIIPIYHDVTRNLVKPWVSGFHPNVQDLHPIRELGIRREWRR